MIDLIQAELDKLKNSYSVEANAQREVLVKLINYFDEDFKEASRCIRLVGEEIYDKIKVIDEKLYYNTVLIDASEEDIQDIKNQSFKSVGLCINPEGKLCFYYYFMKSDLEH